MPEMKKCPHGIRPTCCTECRGPALYDKCAHGAYGYCGFCLGFTPKGHGKVETPGWSGWPAHQARIEKEGTNA